MNVNPLEALSGFVSKAAAILPKGFTGPQQELALTTYDDMSDVSKWMQQEKFLNFTGMLVSVPPGFNTYAMDHIERLESVWDTLQKIHDGVLRPIDKQLSALTHEVGMLSLPVGFRYKDVKFPLKNINPKDLVEKLSKSYTNNVIDQRAIEKTFHSAGEIDIAFNRAKALNLELTKKLRTNVDNTIESIHASVDIIANATVHPNVAKELVLMVDCGSDWVELFGLFMKQVNEMIECLNTTGERLKELKSNKK
ncbi:hypothetical protein STRATTON_237 [Erwinia phage vB_EamM_Stratton]|uniref:Uncharacterized protein n=2 Tax=Erskinevirus EaH2 TaxID=2169883 RepID=A0A1B2IHE3_9CAUD|nr:hypothetical protein G173_gp137 [Erwinia phage phiEaH2]AFQ96682.1 hypothetical protein [Erwinia phage phiEaH2]ANZ50662.1 hypothetical protein STRATTON_237 [Erwinia phage vB_EamM_Stratton]